MKPPIFWARLESPTSVIGENGSVVGTPVYSACKFGNGLDVTTTTDYLNWTNTLTPTVTNNPHTICFWWKPHYASTYGGNSDFLGGFDNSDVNEYVFTFGWPTAHYFEWNSYMGGYKSVYTWPGSFSSGDLMFIRFSFDGSLGALQKVKMYINEVLQTPTIYSGYDSAWTYTLTMPLFKQIAWAQNKNSVYDNLMVFDYILSASEGLKVMNIERGGMNDYIQ